MKADDPIARFTRWFRQEVGAGTNSPETMALATCGIDGIPSVRYVLLKQADDCEWGGRVLGYSADRQQIFGQCLPPESPAEKSRRVGRARRPAPAGIEGQGACTAEL